MNVPAVIVLLCAGWVLFVLAGYPLWLALRARFGGRPPRAGSYEPFITAIIPVHNGVQFLAAKLDSVLNSSYPPAKLDVIVVSDASTDGTDEVAADYARRFPDRVRYRRLPKGGKACALNAALPEVTSEVLLLTDVRQILDPLCVRRLAAMLHDPEVGVVSGNLKIRAGNSAEESNVGLYWRYESWIRRNLGLIDSLLGATGPIYVMRRALARPLPESCILDDVWLPMQAVLAGYRAVFDEHAIAWDYPTSLSAEFVRKVRTQAGMFQLAWQLPGLISPRNRLLSRFVFYKFARLLMPEVLIVFFFASLVLPAPYNLLLILGQALFYALAAADPWLREGNPVKRLTAPIRAFVVLLTAALCAVSIFFVSPEKLWKRTRVSTHGSELK